MQSETQLLKGILEGCILAIVAGGETYGYEILESLKRKGFDSLQEATVYPILVRLKNKGFLYQKLVPSPLGPMRKYYSLSEGGACFLKSFISQWEEMKDKVDPLVKEVNL